MISVAVMLLAFYGFPAAADAHTNLERTLPENGIIQNTTPETVELWFEDPVNVHSESVKVTNQEGRGVFQGNPFSDPADARHVILNIEEKLSPGVYTVQYHFITSDGYVIKGQYKFEVGKPDQSTPSQEKLFQLVKSNPADGEVTQTEPTQIELWFSQPATVTALGVFNKDNNIFAGQPVADPHDPKHITVPLEKSLPPGTYQATWYAAPIDETGSVNRQEYVGLFYFSVKEVTTLVSDSNFMLLRPFYNPIGLKQIADWFAFIGLLSLAGGSWFQTIIAGTSGNRKRWNLVSWSLYGMSVTGFVTLIILRRFELPQISFLEFVSLNFVWIPVLQILLMSLGVFLLGHKQKVASFAIAIMLWPISTGHATYPRYGGYFAVSLDIVHLLAVSVWMGGLFALLLLMPKEEPLPWLEQKGRKFTQWAFWSMILIIVSGIIMSVQYVPNFTLGSLLASDWGKALLLKAILVATVVGIAYWQRRTLQRISEKGLIRVVRRGRIELLFALMILFAAAMLIESTPSAANQGIYPRSIQKDDLKLTVDIKPLTTETNDIFLDFMGAPELKQVKVKMFMPPDWTKENTAFPLGNGRYKLTGNFLHGSGNITMEVEAVKSDGSSVLFPVRIVVPGEQRMDN